MLPNWHPHLRSFVARHQCGFAVPVAACLALASIGVVRAVEGVTLEIEGIAGADWQAEGVSLQLDLGEDTTKAHGTIRSLRFTALADPMRNVSIDCEATEISNDIIACRAARIGGTLASLGSQKLTGRVQYHRRSGVLDLELAGLRIGDGNARVKATLGEAGWTTDVQLEQAAIEPITVLARDWKLPLPQLSATGSISASLSARGAQSRVRQAELTATVTGVTANNPSGSLAAENFSFKLNASLERQVEGWGFDVRVNSNQGQAYAQPVFLDLGQHAIALNARGQWTDAGVLRLDDFAVDHRDVVSGRGSGVVDFDLEQPIQALHLKLHRLQFPGAYASYFQPLLLDSSFKSLQTSGDIAGYIVIEAGMPKRIDLAFGAVTVNDGSGTLAVNGLQGEWHWQEEPDSADVSDSDDEPATAQAQDSFLNWRSGSMLNLALGKGAFEFNSQGRQFRLLRPARLAVLDGAIELQTFRVRNVGQPNVAFLVDATIVPISVQALCKAFGWPEFGGSIGGVISKLRMRDKVVTLGTTLKAQVFDGDVTIKDLRLEQPFSQWPRFQASIALDNLDLELVTSAFSFGRITGRLSGAINGLELFNWTPVAFDARLFTPPKDRSRHRISQRAVENIGSIGGGGAGVAGALSSGFLQFFDDFNYDRLGLSCRLEQDVCVMNGVAPAPNGGYYLVKGSGLPRIDVIGSAHRVDWPRLVQQLIAVTQSGGPVVR